MPTLILKTLLTWLVILTSGSNLHNVFPHTIHNIKTSGQKYSSLLAMQISDRLTRTTGQRRWIKILSSTGCCSDLYPTRLGDSRLFKIQKTTSCSKILLFTLQTFPPGLLSSAALETVFSVSFPLPRRNFVSRKMFWFYFRFREPQFYWGSQQTTKQQAGTGCAQPE